MNAWNVLEAARCLRKAPRILWRSSGGIWSGGTSGSGSTSIISGLEAASCTASTSSIRLRATDSSSNPVSRLSRGNHTLSFWALGCEVSNGTSRASRARSSPCPKNLKRFGGLLSAEVNSACRTASALPTLDVRGRGLMLAPQRRCSGDLRRGRGRSSAVHAHHVAAAHLRPGGIGCVRCDGGIHLVLGPEVILHTVKCTLEVRTLVSRGAAHTHHAGESSRPNGLTGGESVSDVVTCRGKDSHSSLVSGIDRMSPATCRQATHADRDSPAPRCDRVLNALGHRAAREMDHGISDANRHDLNVRRAAQEVVERWLTLRMHAPSGQQR